jgi:hypothetical protein
VGPTAGLDTVEKKKISCVSWESNDSWAAQLVVPYCMRDLGSFGALTEEKLFKSFE